MKHKALLIGCGNIGAGYDFNSDAVETHAKAYSLDNDFSFEIYDRDEALASKVANKYNVKIAENLSDDYLKGFDVVSICSPTTTHFQYLKQLIDLKTPLIICEKPVSLEPAELVALEEIYAKGSTKILVNYMRRFQPAFISLKEIISELLKREPITNINIRYQRGFINNASHAFDLLNFLFDKDIDLEEVVTSNRVFDEFTTDPTLSLTAYWGMCNFNVLGLSNVKLAFFEIDLFFQNTLIEIDGAKDTIEISEAAKNDTSYNFADRNIKTITHCIKDYMLPVMQAAKALLNNQQQDNFNTSVRLADKMIKYKQ